jgi:hypothetical protein
MGFDQLIVYFVDWCTWHFAEFFRELLPPKYSAPNEDENNEDGEGDLSNNVSERFIAADFVKDLNKQRGDYKCERNP